MGLYSINCAIIFIIKALPRAILELLLYFYAYIESESQFNISTLSLDNSCCPHYLQSFSSKAF